MGNKPSSVILLTLLSASILMLAFNIQQVETIGVHNSTDNIYDEIAGEPMQSGDPTPADSWPSFGHDLQNTRTSSSSAPNLPNLLWTFTGQFQGSAASPVVSEGRVFVGSELVNEFYCLNATNGVLLWVFGTNGTIMNSPAVSAGKVLVGTESGFLYCLNETTGMPIWNVALDERIYESSPAVADGRVFVGGWAYGDYGSHLYCLNLTNGDQLWKYQVYQAVYSSPAVVNGKVFVGGTGPGAGKVYCVNETTGENVWTYTTGDHVGRSSPSVVDGRVFIGSLDKHVYCLSESDGKQLWNYTTASWTDSSPAVADGNVFTASEDGTVYCLNATSGTKIWTYKAINQVTSSPSVADGMLFISSSNIYGGLIALNTTDGKLIWNYSAIIQGSSVAIADGKIFASFLGGICCIGSPYSLTITPTFNDNNGNALDPPPSQWSVLFPNGTIITVSSASVTFPLAFNGNYSMISIIWQGTEVVPEIPPSIFVASDTVWIPTINCRLPTHLTIALSTSTSYIGFKVYISGKLVDYKNTSLAGAMILMEYSVTGGEPWSVITADYTKVDGSYSAMWMPSATGNYLVRATWSGNATYPRTNATVNLAVIPFEEQYVFSVESNSTISGLAFNTTDWALSFTATGPNGTRGYVKVTVAKSLVANITNIRVYLDGNQTEYSIASTDDSWLLTFNYIHSTHKVAVDLDINIVPEFPLSSILLLFMTAIMLPVIAYKRKSGSK
jgi:outer membrane protein assembly factor BamB